MESDVRRGLAERAAQLDGAQRTQGIESTGNPADQFRGTPIENLRQFLGIWTPEDADEIWRIIQDECRRIDPRDWEPEPLDP